jgi:hypothetical protein
VWVPAVEILGALDRHFLAVAIASS